jgi:colanic acid biosynthesis protein WcaH
MIALIKSEQDYSMLDADTFKTVIGNTPLVSIDLCLVCDHRLLLGRRTNEPMKGEWFTPGGRIHKNEAWQDALRRIAEVELGLSFIAVEDFSLMGVWDHFYSNSVLDQEMSTHYVNLPHYAEFKYRPQITSDDQHGEFKWFDLAVVVRDEKFSSYMRNYATWLLNKTETIDD